MSRGHAGNGAVSCLDRESGPGSCAAWEPNGHGRRDRSARSRTGHTDEARARGPTREWATAWMIKGPPRRSLSAPATRLERGPERGPPPRHVGRVSNPLVLSDVLHYGSWEPATRWPRRGAGGDVAAALRVGDGATAGAPAAASPRPSAPAPVPAPPGPRGGAGLAAALPPHEWRCRPCSASCFRPHFGRRAASPRSWCRQSVASPCRCCYRGCDASRGRYPHSFMSASITVGVVPPQRRIFASMRCSGCAASARAAMPPMRCVSTPPSPRRCAPSQRRCPLPLHCRPRHRRRRYHRRCRRSHAPGTAAA